MKLDLTEKEFGRLLQLAYLGQFVMNYVDNPRTMSSEEKEVSNLVNYLCQIAYKTGIAEELVEKVEKGISYSMEMEKRCIKIIDALNEDGFLVNLSMRLATRDMEEKYDREPPKTRSFKQNLRIIGVIGERYFNEFEKNGLKNLRLVDEKKD